MATFLTYGYATSDILIDGGGSTLGVGSKFHVDPTWDAATDRLTFTFTDDDSKLGGDFGLLSGESGDDSNQTVVITNSAGTTLYSGKVYSEEYATLTAPDGSTVYLDRIEIGGQLVGYVTNVEFQPGVTYSVTSITNTSDTSAASYANLAVLDYDPDLASSIQGGQYADTLAAGAGNDTITAGAGADTINGGTGDDVIYYGTGGATSLAGDLVYGGDGADVIDDVANASYSYNDTLWGEAGADSIWGGGGNDWIDGGTGNDQLFGEDGDDSIWGREGDDFVHGGAGNDLIDDAYGSDQGQGNDTFDGGDGNDTLWAGLGDDLLYGGAGADNVGGEEGSDTIWGGAGNDSLMGGADEDHFHFGDGWGVDTVLGDNTATTGTDTDWLHFDAVTSGGVSVTFTGSEDGTASLGANTVSFDNIEAVVGSGQADTINAGADGSGLWLDGGAGNDSVIGGSGGDTLIGGAGDDALLGGAGSDQFYFDDNFGTDLVIGGEDTGGGETDLLEFGGSSGLNVVFTGAEAGVASDTASGASVSFSEIEAVAGGAGDDTLDAAQSGVSQSLSGNEGDDQITGGSAADTLAGGEGNDTLSGGAGADYLVTGTGADLVVLELGGGSDRVSDFDMTLTGGRTTDQLDVSDLRDGEGNPVNAWDVTVSDDGAGNAVLSFPGGETVTLDGVSPADVTRAPQLYSMGIPCFAAGTRIATPGGWRVIEALEPGDLVNTLDGPPEPVLWIGQRRVSRGQIAADPALRPVMLRAGALGNERALKLSGAHALWVPGPPPVVVGGGSDVAPGAGPAAGHSGGHLVRARHLARTGWGGARVMAGARQAHFFHLLLPEHALISAEGAWVETFWPGPMALRALSGQARWALMAALPRLARVVLGGQPVHLGYGPMVRPLLPRAEVTRRSCVDWSRMVQKLPRTKGFQADAGAGWRDLGVTEKTG